MLKWFDKGRRPATHEITSMCPAMRHYWNLWDSLVIKEGQIYRNFCSRDGIIQNSQFILPDPMKKEILFQMHDGVLSGHLGSRKTLQKTRQNFYWFNMKQDINIYVQQCDVCAASKESNKSPRAPLGSMPVGAPLDRLATDILGPLPLTPRGNKYVLIVGDYFTKWVEIFPVPDQTAKTCAMKIVHDVIGRFGSPLQLHSDQGRNYESEIFKQICDLLEIRKTRTSARNPKCNGMIERRNRTLLRMIRAYLRGEQQDWDLYLGCLAAAYRSTPNESTGFIPNMLMLGREVRQHAEVIFGSEVTSYGDYVEDLKCKKPMMYVVNT